MSSCPVTYRDCCCDNREKGKYILFEQHRSILRFSMVQGHVIRIRVITYFDWHVQWGALEAFQAVGY